MTVISISRICITTGLGISTVELNRNFCVNVVSESVCLCTRWPSGTRLDFAIARSRVRLPPVAAVYQRLLSVPSLRGRLMSSSLRATEWRPSAADWGGSMSVVLRRGSTCPLSRAVDGCIPRHGIIIHQLMPISCHFQDCEALLFVLTTCKQRCLYQVSRLYLLPFYCATFAIEYLGNR